MADVWPHLLTLLGAGGLQAIVSAVINSRRERRKQDADLAERAFDHLEAGREDTQRHVTELVTCERRCAALERDNAALRARVEELEDNDERQRSRIGELEREVALMRLAVDSLLAGERPSSTIATVAPIGRR